MNDLPEVITRLGARLDALEQRVIALEHPQETAHETVTQTANARATATPDEHPSASVEGRVFPVLGRAMLGVAGAYLLRAVAESSLLPKTIVAAVAIAYALGWLVWASRAKAGEWVAGTTYAGTSALILVPMLWELTLRFQVMPVWATALVLSGFVVAASLLTWKRKFAAVLWVAHGAAGGLALMLAFASNQLTPFIAVLLLMVVIGEFAAARDHDFGTRILASLAADLLIWAGIYIYSGPENARPAYPPLGAVQLVAPGIALFLILGLSLIYRNVLREKTISIFDTVEITIAFLLAACALIYFGPASSTMTLGVFCLAFSVAGYSLTLIRFERTQESRNFVVFSSWSGALLLAGSLLCLPHGLQASLLSVVAAAIIFAGGRLGRIVLRLQGVVFILTAIWISGLGDEAVQALAGSLPGAPGLGICVVSVCAILCYAALNYGENKTWMSQSLSIALAALATAALAALGVHALAGLVALKVIPEAHHLAFIRTLMACIAAVLLAYSGAHWRRMELTRVGYAILALLAVKLVLEDMRHGHLAFVAGSIFLFAVTLIVVPRVARARQRA